MPRRPLLLTGFMATGKSTVGRVLAQRVGVPFYDLDVLVSERAGLGIEQIFAQKGEVAFRAMESEVLADLLADWADRPVVVSLGGGALLDTEQRVRALSQAVVVCLTASPGEIARRAREQEGAASKRPLLAGPDPEGAIERLLLGRAVTYRESHAQLETEGLSPERIADAALWIWEEDTIAVAAGEQTYLVRIGEGVTETQIPHVFGDPSGVLLVSDSNVAPLHAGPVRRAIEAGGRTLGYVELAPGEEHKNLQALEAIYQQAFEQGLDRKGLLVGLGGGVVTDMTGFAAATWGRGVRWIGLPTTLLSMVDASVGGKTGVDYRAAKNAVGSFWQPSGVICDVLTLQTESERMFRGALSEVVKTALIGDPELFRLLETRADQILQRDCAVLAEVVRRCVRVKARVVGLDEREQGIRATLNLGHTIGHALESSAGYTGLTHGEAVSLGLVAALRLGEQERVTPPELTARVLSLLARLELPRRLDEARLREATALLGHDKKRAGDAVKFVFVRGLGDVITQMVELGRLVEKAPTLADTRTSVHGS